MTLTATEQIHWDFGISRILAIAAVGISLTGCANVIPLDAPDAVATHTNAALVTEPSAPLAYALMPVNPAVMQATNAFTDSSGLIFSHLPGGNYRDVTIGVGDIVTVTVYEAQAGGLFIPREAGVRPGNFVDIPRQQVDQSGNINIPYAGSIKVAGLTPRAVSNIVRERLKDRAIDPQAVVSVAEQRGNQISVLGEVNSPQRFPVDPGGIRLMGAIARAGGPKYPSYESTVTIKREGRTYSESMSSVVHHPNEDVLLAPGDVVFLTRIPRVYMAFGSTPSPGSIGGTNNRRFTFENDNMSLAEALAKAGGLDGARADSKSIYVYRFEPKPLLERIGIDVSQFPTKTVPAVYKFDMSKPDGWFQADTFRMRDHDVISVAESPSTEFIKLMNPLDAASTNASNISSVVVNSK
ncbi:polysaccharide biosynthesis/export family protein [Bradyrhizobium guangdongense]|uniref:Polysaccharide export protein n=1 Tax=Bradyrhizobium guangdongense TaxID=1325090 RepID=A0ABX6UNK9_9BRAD|nr:polysaccharide biosynthesis/export family protein [Bradyrhizobium guangdongense]QAU41320.1 polysaccharide export protein [Bradyrhizobium guangdongense]QOZ62384.1 polysaccharide export protein [Bradyrhizobium guangdongense]